MAEDMLDCLRQDAIRRVLNQNRWDEARYLVILYACSALQPFALQARSFGQFRAFKRVVLRDLAADYGLDFEFFRGAARILEERLEKSFGYVKTFHGDDNFTYYALTPEGLVIAKSALREASEVAQKLETLMLPSALLDRFKRDLLSRAQAKSVDPQIVRRLISEYEEQEAIPRDPETSVASSPREIRLRKHDLTIGRTGENILSFPNDRYMSRKHAVVECINGEYWIRDLHSKNGTWRIDESGNRVRVERDRVQPKIIYEVGTARLMFTVRDS